MADKLKEVLSKIEDLLAVESQSVPADTAGGKRNDRFAETSRLSDGKRRRIRLKSLDEHGLEEILEKVGRIIRDEFSDSSVFLELTSRVSELAIDADPKKIGDGFTKDDLLIIPIVDRERKVIGRYVFAFVR
jgi:hypothetical protein